MATGPCDSSTLARPLRHCDKETSDGALLHGRCVADKESDEGPWRAWGKRETRLTGDDSIPGAEPGRWSCLPPATPASWPTFATASVAQLCALTCSPLQAHGRWEGEEKKKRQGLPCCSLTTLLGAVGGKRSLFRDGGVGGGLLSLFDVHLRPAF